MDKPIITIIIATYNAEPFLHRCLDSIRSQKDHQIELLLIDGKSKDSTMEVIEKNRDIVDFYVSEKDKGIYDAWNKGIHRANGEWIMFLGADDVLLPGSLQAYVGLINGGDMPEIGIISSKNRIVTKDGKTRRIVGELFDYQKHCSRKLEFAHPGMLHSKRMFDRFGVFNLDYKICADTEYFIRHGESIKAAFLDMVTVSMQQGGASSSWTAAIEPFLIRKRFGVDRSLNAYIGLFSILLRLSYSKLKYALFKRYNDRSN